LRRHRLDRRPFVLAVSSTSPNKNFRSVVRALESLEGVDFDVVIAGGTNPRVFGSQAGSLPASVRHVGYVSDGELRALYEHAACFVYPSFYEGFGLPPLEAMACGCPAIVSEAASMPEVCGEAVLYCDPHDPIDIAEKLRRLMDDARLQSRLRQRGLQRAELFSWRRCARETLAVIKEVTPPMADAGVRGG
jgi:glycosyltransferase involved in cell wall biosynthesis